MPNDYRKQGSSGGRVGYDADKAARGERAKMALAKGESLPATFNRSAAVPASAATRQVPIPKPQDTGKPTQPDPLVKATKPNLKETVKYATDLEGS